MSISASRNHDWPNQRLDRVLVYRKRQVTPPELRGKQVFHYSIPIIAATGDGQLENGDEIDSNKFIVTGDEILVSKLNPHKGHLIMTRPHQALAVCSTEFLPLAPREGERRFFYYLYASQPVREQIVARCQSATRSHMRALPEDIWKITAATPPLPSQRAIADFLDRKTQAIDELIRKKERLIELLHEKRQALITQAVTKGLDPSVPMKDSGHDWIGHVPSHWDVGRVKHVARLESGHTPSRSVAEHWLDTNDIPWVSLNDTRWLADHDYISETAYYINELGLQNSSARLLPAHLVVFTRDATIGKAAITTRPMAVSQHIIAWVCGSRIAPEYLLRVFYAMEPALERYTFGATLKTIGMDDVGELVTPIPPLPEQERIVEFVAAGCIKIEGLVDRVTRQVQSIREYRQALISAAVTGQIDVTSEAAA